MFDRLSAAEKIVAVFAGIITPVGLIVAAAVSYGDLRSDVDTLQQQIAELKKPESSKGALCLKLTDELTKSYSDGIGQTLQSREVERQMERVGCYSLATSVKEPQEEFQNSIQKGE